MFVDILRVYRERVYVRIGLTFRDHDRWRSAARDPGFRASGSIEAHLRYPDRRASSAFNRAPEAGNITREDARPADALPAMRRVSSEGSGLTWFTTYLIMPVPGADVIFSASLPHLGLADGEWLLSRSTLVTCLKMAAQYARAREKASESGYAMKTCLPELAEIAARLAHLGARVDFGEERRGREPSVQIPLQDQRFLSIHQILPDDAIAVTVSGSAVDCYLLEVPEGPPIRVIAQGEETVTAAEALVSGLCRQGFRAPY